MSNVKLGKKSQKYLSEVKEDLQKVVVESFTTMPFDITIIEGLRSASRQAELYKSGASKRKVSLHQSGDAIDMVPYPVDWNDKKRFNIMGEHVLAASKRLGIPVRWGGDWNENGDTEDERFYDGPHFELKS